jgi:hypothetical protein
VSYWEWAKLIATAIAISIASTSLAAALGWWIMRWDRLTPWSRSKADRYAGTNNTSMAFDPRQISILEVAGVTTLIVSAVLLAGVVYSFLW